MKTTAGKRKPIFPELSGIGKPILDQAKAFLCWDTYPGLSIQLVEMQEAVSFFYPPGPRSTIIVHYARDISDFSIPVFQLFHEAGHHAQYIEMHSRDDEDLFWELVNTPTGEAKAAFEQASWEQGRILISRFSEKVGLPAHLLESYDAYALKSIASYE